VQKSGGFQEQVELAKTAADRFRTSDVLDAGEEVGYGFLAAGCARAENDFVGVLETKGDGVAVAEGPAFDFFSVNVKAAALAAILDVQTAPFENERGAIARDPAVRELEMVARFRAASDEERGLGDAHVAASAVWRDDLEDCSPHGDGSCVGHGILATGL